MSYLSKQFKEVVDICGAHGLGDVSLMLQVVLAGVRCVHLETVKQTRSTLTVTLKHQLSM